MVVKNIKLSSLICLSGLVALIPVADAQRNSAGAFAGNWHGTLTMDTIFDVPPEHIERLSKPVELEIRLFGRGQADLIFRSPDDEWDFHEQRNFRITLVGEENGVIEARIPGNLSWMSSFSFNLALRGENEILVAWSRLTIRDQLLLNGMDEYGFSGVAIFSRED